MNSITLTQLSYIVAVSKTRNFGLAAKACYVSQPTLSMQIRKLEDDLGVILFDRSKKPVQPTAVGQKIIEQAQRALQEAERIGELIKEEKGEIGGEFKLGIIPTLAPYLLPLFLQDFTRRYAKVQLVIEELQTRQIIAKLGEDSLDAGVLATPLNSKGILERPLFYEPFVAYLTAGHPLSKRKRIQEKDLSPQDIWLLNEGHCFRDQAIQLCKKLKSKETKPKNLTFESGNLETLKRLVDNNFGYTLLPYLAILGMPPREREERIRPFKSPAPTREVSLVYSRSFLKRSVIEALAQSIAAALPKALKKTDGGKVIVDLSSF